MTEEEAQRAVAERVDAPAFEGIANFLAMVRHENAAQNLVAPSTIETIWARHALDSAQLLALAAGCDGLWIDIGTGGGFPGMVVALARRQPTMLIEPRRRRAQFLRDCAMALGLDHVTVRQARVEAIGRHAAAVISARAVAGIENLLHAARQCGTPETRWLLPRGRVDPAELTALNNRQTMFHVEQSITDPASSILVIDGIAA